MISCLENCMNAMKHKLGLQRSDVPPKIISRRKSVFAEPYDPEEDNEDSRQVHPKTAETRASLTYAVRNIFLFRSLDDAQVADVLDAMFERRVTAGEDVIRQGDDGDNFYVIERGRYSIYVQTSPSEEPRRVGGYDRSGSFGELALMYNMPRAATIRADTDGLLWAMDRATFRRIVLRNAFLTRKTYELILDSVPMLKSLQPRERMDLADALVPQTFQDGDIIIDQGDDADGMFFVIEGTVHIMRAEGIKEEQHVATVTKGGYLGELALLTSRPRAASAYAVGEVRVAFLEKGAFERLLGPCMEVMQREVAHYEAELQRVFGGDRRLADLSDDSDD